MTIVEEETMNANQNLEAELDDGEGEMHDAMYGDDFDEVEEGGSDDDAPVAGNPEVAEWLSLAQHPAPTAAKIAQCLRRVSARGRNQLTVLILGRAAVGKSSTVNALYAETVAQAVPFHMVSYQTVQPLIVRRRADNVTFTVIDTPGLVESDAVSEMVLRRIAYQSRSYPVDVVVFADRADIPRPDELDLQMMQGLNRIFGPSIWSRMVIGLTRADIRDPPPGQTYESMIDKRVEGIRGIMRRAGGKDAELPYVLIENADRCSRNAAGEKVLTNGVAWIPTFFETVINVAQKFSAGYRYDSKTVHRQAQFFTKFCLIPLALVVQVLFKVFIFDPLVDEDGRRGDRDGPFEMDRREYERKQHKAKKANKGQRGSSAMLQRERETSLEEEIDDEIEDEE